VSGKGPRLGVCHIHPRPEFVEVIYCGICEHWFCDECRHRWWKRGQKFIEQLVQGKWPGCCGPIEGESPDPFPGEEEK
jgi:hypothetical protein